MRHSPNFGEGEVSLSMLEPHAVLDKIYRRLTNVSSLAVARYSFDLLPCHSCIFFLKLQRALIRLIVMQFDEEEGGIVGLLRPMMKMKCAKLTI